VSEWMRRMEQDGSRRGGGWTCYLSLSEDMRREAGRWVLLSRKLAVYLEMRGHGVVVLSLHERGRVEKAIVWSYVCRLFSLC
jgi:hypothetical protein